MVLGVPHPAFLSGSQLHCVGRLLSASLCNTVYSFIFILIDHGGETDPEARMILSDIQSIYDHLPADGRLRVAIRGANHFMFSDDGAFLKSRILRGALRLFGVLRIDARRQLAVTEYCLRSFFDSYLKSDRSSPLRISSPQYPEIEVLP